MSNGKTYLVTGANVGIGMDAVRQLALMDDTTKVYITARSDAKGNAAIEKLTSKGVASDKLSYIHFEGSDAKDAIREDLAAVLSKTIILDGVILNAGGMGSDVSGKATEPNGVTSISQSNLLAHVHMVDFLLETGRIGKGTRLVFSGSEAARGVKDFGLKKPEYGETSEFYQAVLDGSAYKKYDINHAYAQIKGVAALYFAAWARNNPSVSVLVVSPGGTSGTNITRQGAYPCCLGYTYKVMFFVLQVFGKSHSLQAGAKRYVDAVIGKHGYENYSSGTFVASAKGTTGPVVDQTTLKDDGADFGVVTKQDAAFEAVRSFV